MRTERVFSVLKPTYIQRPGLLHQEILYNVWLETTMNKDILAKKNNNLLPTYVCISKIGFQYEKNTPIRKVVSSW